jgi:16S rRNA U1498 N3-methylase RsmE
MASQQTDRKRTDVQHGEWQSYVREAARQAGLTLSPERLAAVTEHFARLAQQAEGVLAFPLDEDEEPAPVFTP